MERVSALPVRSSHHRLHSFSGGNQQKVLLAKWMRLRPAVLLLDEPTQGVDVGAQSEIHTLLRSTADDGGAVVVASSDTHELVELCDRVLVIQNGRVHRELRGDSLEEHTLVEAILDSRADTKVKTPDDA
jgi:ribose transport system ATP-binding protein